MSMHQDAWSIMWSINTEVIPTSFFLAQELIPGYLNGIEGTYQTPKGYYVAFENKDAFEAYETTFPQKEKKKHEGQLVDDCTNNPNDQQYWQTKKKRD